MSAFMVSKQHIDALVRCAIDGPADTSSPWEGPRWSHDGESRSWAQAGPSGNSSVESLHPDLVGLMLWGENAASVRERYPDADAAGMIPELWDYAYDRRVRRLTAVEALKAIDCFEYQSCEHEAWQESEARRFCEALRGTLIGALPGYDDAPWDVSVG